MPQCMQPKTLYNICVDFTALRIDQILKREGLLHGRETRIRDLPQSLYHDVLDKIIEVGALNDYNYQKILGWQTKAKNLMFRKVYNSISKPIIPADFLDFLQEYCKNLVKIDLTPLLSTNRKVVERYENILIGETLASMVHLEWINLKGCGVDDECLKYIGSKCTKLKYLNLEGCTAITDEGIRSLFDPSMAPAGKCTKLTHLYLKTGIFDESESQLSVKTLTSLLLQCQNLEVLDYERSARVLLRAIEQVRGPDWRKEQQAVYNSDVAVLPPARTFKLKTLEYVCGWLYSTFSFVTVQKYCPLLRDFILIPPNVYLGNMLKTDHLPLESARPDSKSQRYMELEVPRLMQQLGCSMGSLTLHKMRLIDLRIISHECPNLKTLTLTSITSCSTPAEFWKASGGNNFSYHKECGMVYFGSLAKFVLFETTLSRENFVDVLSSPNLETLELHGSVSRTISLPPIVEVVTRNFPDAFDKLRSLALHFVQLNRHTLIVILGNATLLNEITFVDCYRYPYGKRKPFNEQAYFDQLIEDSNWDLKCVWRWEE